MREHRIRTTVLAAAATIVTVVIAVTRPDAFGVKVEFGSDVPFQMVVAVIEAVEPSSARPRAADVDGDGVPDRCLAPEDGAFVRADIDDTGDLSLGEAILMLGCLFGRGARPQGLSAADAGADGRIAISEPIVVLGTLFRGTGALPAPAAWCGQDLTPDDLVC